MKKRHLSSLLTAGTLCAGSLVLTTSASAALLFHDGFNYDPGTTSAAESPGGWGSIGSSNLTIGEGSLNYPGVPSSGNRATITGGGNSSHALPGSFNSGTLYFSYLTAYHNESFRTLNVGFFEDMGGNFNGGERFAIGTRGPRNASDGEDYPAPDGNFILLPSNPQNIDGSTEVVVSDNPIQYGADVTMVVGKIEFNFDGGVTDRITLFLNPDTFLGEPVTPYLVSDTNDLGTLTHFRFFAGGASGGLDAAQGSFDEFRFGTTYADVIPEPSTYAAIFGGLVLGLALLRRRLR